MRSPTGEAGELCISGPQVMKGYWNRPDESAKVLRTDADGRIWFHTGDIARMDEDGFTTIVQRKKDMIIVDGFNVYPSEVETVLYLHPAVRLAAVIGIPDDYHGEVVKACVVLKEGASATADELDRALQDGAGALQGAEAGRAARHAADERRRQDPVPCAPRRARSGPGVSSTPRKEPMPTDSRETARRQMSGLEFFRQMVAGNLEPPPMVALLGLRIAEVEFGRVTFVGTPTEAFYNGVGRRPRRLRRDDARLGARLRDQHDGAAPASGSPRSS